MIDADEALRRAFFTIARPGGGTVGGGVCLRLGGEGSEPLLVTCAHVVNLALGRSEFELSHPEDLVIGFPFFSASTEVPAPAPIRVGVRVGRWWPAHRLNDPTTAPTLGTDSRWTGDLAELVPLDPLPHGVQPVPLLAPQLDDELWAWRGDGEPRTVTRLRVNGVAGEWLVLESQTTGYTVGPGYSGGPLWDRRRRGVCGLLVSAHERIPYGRMTTSLPVRQAYAIRGDIIRASAEDGTGAIGTALGGSGPHDSRIWALLRAQQQAARYFPYRSIQNYRDDLTTVYVRQQLGGGPRSFAVDRADLPEYARTVVTRAPRTVEEALSAHRHLIVEGGPGSGKTTLALQLASEPLWIADPLGGAPTGLVPVRVPARDLARQDAGTVAEAVSAVARATTLHWTGTDPGDGLCTTPPSAGMEWLFVVDGLDEIEDAVARLRCAERLAWYMQERHAQRVLITTRPLSDYEGRGWQRFPDLGRFEVEPFQRDQRRDFAQRWFGEGRDHADRYHADSSRAAPSRAAPSRADRFLAEMSAQALDEIVAVPLMATVAAIVFEEDGRTALPRTTFGMYQRFVSHLYESRTPYLLADLRRRLAGWPDAEALTQRVATQRIDMLEHLATEWLRGEEILPTASAWLRGRELRPYPEPTDWASVVTSVLTSTGLVVHDGRTLAFTHRSFAEHLAAVAVARGLPSPFDPDHPAWWNVLRGAIELNRFQDRETLLHRALLMDRDDGLLPWLLAGRHEARALGARLLVEGAPGSEADWQAVVEDLRFRLAMGLPVAPILEEVRVASPALVGFLLEVMAGGGAKSAALRAMATLALRRVGVEREAVIRSYTEMAAEPMADGDPSEQLRAVEALVDMGAPVPIEAVMLMREVVAADGPDGFGRMRGYQHARQLLDELDGREPAPVPKPTPPRGPAARVSSAWDERLFGSGAGLGADAGTGSDTHSDTHSDTEAATSSSRAFPSWDDILWGTGTNHVGHPLLEKNLPRDLAALFGRVPYALSSKRPAPDLGGWDAGADIAGWLCADPERFDPELAAAALRSEALGHPHVKIAGLRILAAALVHGAPDEMAAGFSILARALTGEAREDRVTLRLVQTAVKARSVPFPAAAVRPLVDEIHSMVQGRIGISETLSELVAAAVALGDSDVVEFLIESRGFWLDAKVRVLGQFGHRFGSRIRSVLMRDIPTLPDNLESWLRAVAEAQSPLGVDGAAALLVAAADSLSTPADVLRVCRQLVTFGRAGNARPFVEEIVSDPGVRPHIRLDAIDLVSPVGLPTELAYAALRDIAPRFAPDYRVVLGQKALELGPQGRHLAAELLFADLGTGRYGPVGGRKACQLMAELGPEYRRELMRVFVAAMPPGWSDVNERIWFLEKLGDLGPDLFGAVQSALAGLAVEGPGLERVSAAAAMRRVGWTAARRSTQILTRIATSPHETPDTRISAAYALTGHGDAQIALAHEVTAALVADPAVLAGSAEIGTAVPLVARSLVEHGRWREGRDLLAAYVQRSDVPDKLRYEAGTLLMMVDLDCSAETTDALAFMARDPNAGPDLRYWAGYALESARLGLRRPDHEPETWEFS